MSLHTSESHNSVKLDVNDGKIANVSVYPTRALITRLFKFDAKTGHNNLTISGLPNVQFEDDSVRFEGNETTFIQDYTISATKNKAESVKPKPPRKEDLAEEQEKLSAIALIEDAKKALSSYYSSLNVAPDCIRACMSDFISTGTEYDQKLRQLKSELEEVRERMKPKQISPTPSPSSTKPSEKIVVVSAYCEAEGEVEIVFHYAVNTAGWKPLYDIMINSETKKVKLLYRASISQRTKEDWVNASLTLETSEPNFAGDLRPLYPWRLHLRSTNPNSANPHPYAGFPQCETSLLFSSRGPTRGVTPKAHTNVHQKAEDPHSIATFEVQEPKTILGDGTIHKVTVAELELDGELRWVTIPKMESKMRWNASVQNKSEYPILNGAANVFVNKSLISRSDLAYTSPQDHFTCSLGFDPSIQVIYHPREKKHSQKGLISKSDSHTFEQRITVINKKSCDVTNVKVIDQIPVSEDNKIIVNLLHPALPQRDGSTGKSDDMSRSVQVSKGVVARWEKGDNEEVHVDKLGADGKLCWICSISARRKVDLVLAWEVTHPVGESVLGINKN